jgi:predicted cupin superfamily sugar epimerase
MVQTDDGRGERWAMTTVLYLLREGDTARWHRVSSDEAWHWYEGAPVEMLLIDPTFTKTHRCVLGPVTHEQLPTRAVPAGWWQCARPLGAYTLTGCAVGPGFEFSDHQMLSAHATMTQRLRTEHPDLVAYL